MLSFTIKDSAVGIKKCSNKRTYFIDLIYNLRPVNAPAAYETADSQDGNRVTVLAKLRQIFFSPDTDYNYVFWLHVAYFVLF